MPVAAFTCPGCGHTTGDAFNVYDDQGYVVGLIIECRRCRESELTYFGPAPDGTGARSESENGQAD